MPIRDRAPLGAPCWIDLTTSDIDRARQFYGTVFGWTFESAGPDYGGYVNAAKDGQSVAGLMPNRPEAGGPDNWATYLSHLRRRRHRSRGDGRGRLGVHGTDGDTGEGPHVPRDRPVGRILRAVAAA